MNAEKDALRQRLVSDYLELHTDYVAASDKGIYRNLSELPEYIAAKTIFIYCCIDREPDTVRLTRLALKQGKTVALPVSLEHGIMVARELKSFSELVPSRFGIPAPREDARTVERDDIDLIVVPAVAYDKQGNRLGRGGGYYDRYLSGFPGFTVGIVREKFLLSSLPHDEHDMRVNCVVTEDRVIRF